MENVFAEAYSELCQASETFGKMVNCFSQNIRLGCLPGLEICLCITSTDLTFLQKTDFFIKKSDSETEPD